MSSKDVFLALQLHQLLEILDLFGAIELSADLVVDFGEGISLFILLAFSLLFLWTLAVVEDMCCLFGCRCIVLVLLVFVSGLRGFLQVNWATWGHVTHVVAQSNLIDKFIGRLRDRLNCLHSLLLLYRRILRPLSVHRLNKGLEVDGIRCFN